MERGKYNYIILPEKRLIIRYYHGAFSLSDLFAVMDATGQDNLYDPTFNVINDFRDGTSGVKIKEINELFGYIKGHKRLYGNRRSAFLTKTEDQTVLRMMLRLLKYEHIINLKTFSTLQEATEWLGLPNSELEALEKTLEEFKKAT